MNAISLHQPWASAIAVGLKTIETRGWPAPRSAIGQPLAIAAAKKDTAKLRQWWMTHVRAQPAVYEYFARAGMEDWDDLPKGKVVCMAILRDCVSTNDAPPADIMPCPTDEMLGDFSANRFAWFLANIVPLPAPVPIIGRQGIFSWVPPAFSAT